MRLRLRWVRLALLCVGLLLPINLLLQTILDSELQVGGKAGESGSGRPAWGGFNNSHLRLHDAGGNRTGQGGHASPAHLSTGKLIKDSNASAPVIITSKPVWYYLSPSRNLSHLWPPYPHQNITRDRIADQLRYTPKFPTRDDEGKEKLKTIIALNMRLGAGNTGRTIFMRDKCPVNTCTLRITGNVEGADAVVFKSLPSPKHFRKWRKGNNSVWVWYELESPYHSSASHLMDGHVNWTATYRRDSTIVAPYEKFVPFENSTRLPETSPINYAANKTGLVAWFVSNCKDKSGRLNYARELGKYIAVDIYGACGNLTCPRQKSSLCFSMLSKNYKFYLSFENSACRDYISEKFYWNALQNNIVPIVLGAHPRDYAAVAPPHSYIHVDDFESPRHLADYLRQLDADDNKYNQYFRWKGTGSYINTKFWCRLCGMLHAAEEGGVRQWYPSVLDWATRGQDQGPACLPNPGKTGWVSWRPRPPPTPTTSNAPHPAHANAPTDKNHSSTGRSV